MSEPLRPPTRSPHPTPPAAATRDDPRRAAGPAPDGRASSGGLGAAGLTRATQQRRGLGSLEDDQRNLMHRLLITSPWERYQMDRDAAGRPVPEDDA